MHGDWLWTVADFKIRTSLEALRDSVTQLRLLSVVSIQILVRSMLILRIVKRFSLSVLLLDDLRVSGACLVLHALI